MTQENVLTHILEHDSGHVPRVSLRNRHAAETSHNKPLKVTEKSERYRQVVTIISVYNATSCSESLYGMWIWEYLILYQLYSTFLKSQYRQSVDYKKIVFKKGKKFVIFFHLKVILCTLRFGFSYPTSKLWVSHQKIKLSKFFPLSFSHKQRLFYIMWQKHKEDLCGNKTERVIKRDKFVSQIAKT